MTKSFIDMMALLEKGARGEQIQDLSDYNIAEIKRVAKAQKIWPMVYYAMGENTPEMMMMAVNKIQRQHYIHEITKKLEQAGISCCYLKGEILDDLYKEPSLRLTSDTDIYIDLKFEKETLKILKENDFLIIERDKTSHEQKCVHKKAGLLEIHFDLDNKQMKEIWFNNKAGISEPFRQYSAKSGITYTTLSETDGLVFVTLHFIKHYIGSVGNLKMIMDILTYMDHYNAKINWNKFNTLMDELGYTKIINVLKFIGTKYLGFHFATEDLTELADKILSDIDINNKKDEQTGFYELYTKARFEKFNHSTDYKKYQRKLKIMNFKKIFFPNRITLTKKYPYLIEKPYLFPYAWCCRAIAFVTKKSTPSPPVKKDEDRLHIIKELDLM